MTKLSSILDGLQYEKRISFSDFKYLMELKNPSDLFSYARNLSLKNFGNKIYIRGLIEISTYCKNDCYYCGLRKSNSKMRR